MENKINIAKLLKDCPKGMELYSPIFGELKFAEVNTINNRILVVQQNDYIAEFESDGRLIDCKNGECLLFPKGKTTWEGFQRPFMDGDVVVTTLGNIAIIRKPMGAESFYVYGFMINNDFYPDEYVFVKVSRFATEEEKEKLLQAIKDNGYKWNSGTKTLEKLIEPKFKVGDRIKKKGDYISGIITCIDIDNFYKVEYDKGGILYINSEAQDNYELVPNKFDINTLVPFESRVLVRSSMDGLWKPAVFGFRNGYNDNAFYIVGGSCWKQCIPYEGNEHLLGTTNDCEDFYKTWEV